LSFSQEKIFFENGDKQDAFENMKSIEKLIWGNNLKGHTFLFRKELLNDYQYSGDLSFDYVLALCSCIRNTFVSTNKILSIWRRHSNVCTFAVLKNSSFKIEQISSWKKMLICMYCLIKGERSSAINQSFKDRSNLIKSIIGNDKKLLSISILLKQMSKQNILSYILAGIRNIFLLKYENKFSSLSLRIKIGTILFLFKMPFVYWYDMHNENSLE